MTCCSPGMHHAALRVADQMQVSAGRVTPVLLKGAHAGGGLFLGTPQALQMTAVPLQVPPSPAVAVKDTCQEAGVRCGWFQAEDTTTHRAPGSG